MQQDITQQTVVRQRHLVRRWLVHSGRLLLYLLTYLHVHRVSLLEPGQSRDMKSLRNVALEVAQAKERCDRFGCACE